MCLCRIFRNAFAFNFDFVWFYHMNSVEISPKWRQRGDFQEMGGQPMFSKILIANRGEIAVRIVRACRTLGVRAAAVYSEADRGALHVRMADEAYPIGPAAPAESYLNAERIVGVAGNCGAEAVHPGYGFLAEDAGFAEECERAGLVFIGPSSAVLRSAGDKIASREAADRAGLPVMLVARLGGTDEKSLQEAAERVGFPLLVKAAAGGRRPRNTPCDGAGGITGGLPRGADGGGGRLRGRPGVSGKISSRGAARGGTDPGRREGGG